MRKAKVLATLFFVVLMGLPTLAQVASISSISTASGFLDVCGRPDSSLSKEQMDAMNSAPSSEYMDKLKDGMASRTVEVAMCLAFVSGLVQGWKEGHEHGVAAAQFTDGWPKDEEKALAAQPLKQLQAASAAMSRDVPCIPDYITIGQERDIIVKYIRAQEKKGNFLLPLALTSHMMWLAFQEAFQCPAQPTKTPDAVK